MREYAIEYTHDEMGDMTFRTSKWAHDEKSAVRLLLAKNPDKNGYCVFKRGGTGRILKVEQASFLAVEPVRSSPRDEQQLDLAP